MMNIILLTAIIFTVALLHGAQGQYFFQIFGRTPSEPCQQTSSNNKYGTFVHRHIVNDNNLDRNSEDSWARYLMRKRLCGRVPVQSFIDASEWRVQQICSEDGWRVSGNLCISDSTMTVYDVTSEWDECGCCKVTRLRRRQQKVVVACNNVGNQCLPVHYEKYNNQSPTNVPCIGPTDL